MVRDLPDFVTGLVNIAQRGRSLGIHLILATQRPSGAVSADIRANTNLRIALRVTDANESADVIEAPEAAHISQSTPGRGYVRLGHASLVPFQAGRVGGAAGTTATGAATTGATGNDPGSARMDWSSTGRPEPQRPSSGGRDDEEITDLKVLVQAIRVATRQMRIPAAHSPWLPALPATLLLRDLPGTAGQSAGAEGRAARRLPAFPYGVDDLPAAQAAAPGAHQPGHVRAHDGGRRPAQRPVPAAADDRRLRGPRPSLLRRAHLRHRLRERRPAAARRPAALRRGGHPHPGRAGGAADHPARRGGQPGVRTCWPTTDSPTSASSVPRLGPARDCRTS